MRDPVFAPQPADDLDGLGEPAHALRHGHTEYLELLRAIAEFDAEQELAAGDDVKKGADFGQLDRIVQRQQRDVGPDPQALGLRGEPMQQRQLRKEVEARGDVVLAGPDRVKAERADKAHLLHRFGETAGGIVACRVLRVQVDANLHCRSPVVLGGRYHISRHVSARPFIALCPISDHKFFVSSLMGCKRTLGAAMDRVGSGSCADVSSDEG